MKKLIFLIVLIHSFIACSNEDNTHSQELPVTIDNLVGTWISVEYRTSFGTELGPFEPFKENDQFTYIFSNNSINDSRIECIGDFELKENILEFDFECDESSTWKVSSLTENKLILIKIYSEGLVIKLNRIK